VQHCRVHRVQSCACAHSAGNARVTLTPGYLTRERLLAWPNINQSNKKGILNESANAGSSLCCTYRVSGNPKPQALLPSKKPRADGRKNEASVDPSMTFSCSAIRIARVEGVGRSNLIHRAPATSDISMVLLGRVHMCCRQVNSDDQ
jgi:hypothetical protein